jgi:hypothetical protein
LSDAGREVDAIRPETVPDEALDSMESNKFDESNPVDRRRRVAKAVGVAAAE